MTHIGAGGVLAQGRVPRTIERSLCIEEGGRGNHRGTQTRGRKTTQVVVVRWLPRRAVGLRESSGPSVVGRWTPSAHARLVADVWSPAGLPERDGTLGEPAKAEGHSWEETSCSPSHSGPADCVLERQCPSRGGAK